MNTLLGPVSEVDHGIPNSPMAERVFDSDPAVVGGFASTVVEAATRHGVVTSAKHFPGLAATNVDSHEAVPTVSGDAADWNRTDRQSFERVIAAGVPMVMVGHVRVPGLDPDGVPATISRPVVDGLLRGCLGFEGVIVTDSLTMAAAGALGGPEESAVRAIEAGVDLLLWPPDYPRSGDALREAVEEGRIEERRIDDSVRRILMLKQRFGLLRPRLVETDDIEGRLAAVVPAGLQEQLDHLCGGSCG